MPDLVTTESVILTHIFGSANGVQRMLAKAHSGDVEFNHRDDRIPGFVRSSRALDLLPLLKGESDF